MDCHDWKETHGTHFLCARRSLPSTGHALDWMARFSSLGIFLTLSRRINNAPTDKLNNEPNRRQPLAEILRQAYHTPFVYQSRKHSLAHVSLQPSLKVLFLRYSLLAGTGNQIQD